MGRIFAKAEREKFKQDMDEILALFDDMDGENFQMSKQTILSRLEEMIAEPETESSESTESSDGWDFRKEKAARLFAEDDVIRLRPFSCGDEKFYFLIREQYKIFKMDFPEEQLIANYRKGLQRRTSFYCVIERRSDGAPLGYIALKDTSRALWEIAIELDQQYCRHGYGSRAIVVFLQEVKRITGKSQFQFLVEVDNVPCQNCMKKVNARLVGIHNLTFDSVEKAESFERKNLALITEHMKSLAGELDVAPRKLLSHVLDYRLD